MTTLLVPSLDKTRITELKTLIQRLGPDIPCDTYLLNQAEQAHARSPAQTTMSDWSFLEMPCWLAATSSSTGTIPISGVILLISAIVSVSDRWLAAAGSSLNLDPLLLFSSHARDAFGKETLRADTTEALIGALYTAFGDLQAIDRWLTPHWHANAKAVLNNLINIT